MIDETSLQLAESAAYETLQAMQRSHPLVMRALADGFLAALFVEFSAQAKAVLILAFEGVEHAKAASAKPARIGKKRAGRLLDGRTHDEMPGGMT